MIGYLLLWFGKEATSTRHIMIKQFREILSFVLHCTATEGASVVGAFLTLFLRVQD